LTRFQAEIVEKTEEELAAAQEKKSIMIDRLREQTAKKKAENVSCVFHMSLRLWSLRGSERLIHGCVWFWVIQAAQRDRSLILFRELRANRETMTEDEFEVSDLKSILGPARPWLTRSF